LRPAAACRRLETVQDRNQIAQLVVPDAALVAVEGPIVFGVNVAVKFLPA
jgi:hypothetical protein